MKTINTIQNIDSETFKLKLGTFDKKNPSTIFIEGSGYITPNSDYNFISLKSQMSRILSGEIKKMIMSTNLFDRKFISIVDIPEDRIKEGRKTYFSFEYHLKQKEVKTIKSLSEYKNSFIYQITNNLKSRLADNGLEITRNK